MSLPQKQILYTEDQYLSIERESEDRHEYLDGQIFAMVGESPQHGDICTNLVAEISSQLKGTPCRIWAKDSKVRSCPMPKRRYSTKGLYSYPDAVIVCGKPQFLDDHEDALINPKVIIEVVSPSTEAFDRGEKFQRFRTHNPSLTDYLIVAQNRPYIEHFTRQENGKWMIATSAVKLSESVHIASINCVLQLVEVYDRVEFPEEQDPDDDQE